LSLATVDLPECRSGFLDDSWGPFLATFEDFARLHRISKFA
jgi:hypothetical protein